MGQLKAPVCYSVRGGLAIKPELAAIAASVIAWGRYPSKQIIVRHQMPCCLRGERCYTPRASKTVTAVAPLTHSSAASPGSALTFDNPGLTIPGPRQAEICGTDLQDDFTAQCLPHGATPGIFVPDISVKVHQPTVTGTEDVISKNPQAGPRTGPTSGAPALKVVARVHTSGGIRDVVHSIGLPVFEKHLFVLPQQGTARHFPDGSQATTERLSGPGTPGSMAAEAFREFPLRPFSSPSRRESVCRSRDTERFLSARHAAPTTDGPSVSGTRV